jgi:hypothetical protein
MVLQQALSEVQLERFQAEVPKQGRAPLPGDADDPLGATVWGAYILNEIWAQGKIYILIGTLLGWSILLIT